MNEQEQFLSELDGEEGMDVMDQPLNPTQEGDDVEPEEVPEDIKNRRHKRLEAKLQAERDANIKMAARLEAVTEAQKFRQDAEPADYIKSVERIYGTNSPEAIEATELLKTALQGVEERATTRALELYEERQRQRDEAIRNEEQVLDTMIEEIEDEFNVTFTPEMQKGFFRQLEKLSPKDSKGNILNYADHRAVWEEYSSRRQKPSNAAKDLSARSMTPSGAPTGSKLQDDVHIRFLKDHDII